MQKSETTAAPNAAEWLRPRAAAAYLGISYAHLRVLTKRGEGPRSIRLGRVCLYLRDTLKKLSGGERAGIEVSEQGTLAAPAEKLVPAV
jgi:hypothetical protein